MALRKEHENLIFPSGRSAREIYDQAVMNARANNIPLWEALDKASRNNGMVGWDSALVSLSEEILITSRLEQSEPPQLIHSVGIQVSQHFFLDALSRVISVSDPLDMTLASRFKLEPLVVVSLSIEGTPVHGVQLVPFSTTVDIAPALNTLWADDKLLLGVPDKIKISTRLTPFFNDLNDMFTSEKPDITIVDGKDRRHTANLKAALDPYFRVEESVEPSLANVNRAMLNKYEGGISSKDKRITYNTLKRRQRIHHKPVIFSLEINSDSIYLGKPTKIHCKGLLEDGMDYKGLPYFALLHEEITGFQAELVDDDWFLSVLKSLPFSLGVMAGFLGCSRSELELYIKRKTPISGASFFQLSALLNLRFEYTEDQPPYLQSFGPLLLTPKSKKDFIYAYDAVIRGGDHERAFEMVCSDIDSQFRYIVVEAYFDIYVFRLSCGSRICQSIDGKELSGFDGEAEVTPAVFKQIESLYDQISGKPEIYHTVLKGFFDQWFLQDPDQELATDLWFES
tara:strand:- start:92727 stop:94259 length:1533 start_codon:yes stop_codon:yes gene_type:complete